MTRVPATRLLRLRPLFPSFLVVLGGCLSSSRDWTEFQSPPRDFEQVWRTVIDKGQVNGFKPEYTGPEATDRGLREYHSRWITREYGALRNATIRRRMHAEFEPSPSQPGAWQVRVCIERQVVKDMVKKMNPEENDWTSDGQDKETEQRIAIQVQMEFGVADAIKPRERGK